MAKGTRNKKERIYLTIARGPKRGLSALEVAERTELNPATVRSYIYGLLVEGTVRKNGKVETGRRGRPQLLYYV